MDSLTVFAYQDRAVRTYRDEKGDIWFCLVDVLRAMGTSTTPPQAQAFIIEGFGEGQVIVTPTTDSLQRERDTVFVSEAAVTFLISRSRTTAGKNLNRWIHAEVLPSIRKTGSYQVAQLEKQFLPEVPLKQITELADMMGKYYGTAYSQRLLALNLQKFYPHLALPAAEPEEKASVSDGSALLTPTQLAAKLQLFYTTGKPNPQVVNKLLEQLGYQEKVAGQWSATDKAIDLGICDRKPVETNSRSQKDQLLWNRKILAILSEHTATAAA